MIDHTAPPYAFRRSIERKAADSWDPNWNPSRFQMLATLGPLIYAVRFADGIVKIGHTSNLGRRLTELQCQRGDAELVGFMRGTIDDERAIHRKLAPSVHSGREYYHPTDAVIRKVNHMRRQFGLPKLEGP